MTEEEAGTPAAWPWEDWVSRLSFQGKLSLMVNLLIILLIVGSALLVERRQRTAIVQEVEKRALVMAKALESATAADLVTYNYVSIEQTVSKFSKEPDVVYVVVLDKEGNAAAQYLRDYPCPASSDGSLPSRRIISPPPTRFSSPAANGRPSTT